MSGGKRNIIFILHYRLHSTGSKLKPTLPKLYTHVAYCVTDLKVYKQYKHVFNYIDFSQHNNKLTTITFIVYKL